MFSQTTKKGNEQEDRIGKTIYQNEKSINESKQPFSFTYNFLSSFDFEYISKKLIEQGKSPLGELIGSGSEANIYRSEDQKVVYRVGQAEDRQKYQDFIIEFEIVKSIKNSISIINYQDAIFLDSILVAVIQMEECQCSLFQELKNYSLSKKKISFMHFLNIMFDLFDGLIELRSHNIINSDIKPGNILKTKDNVYIISDFGISLKTRDQQTRIDEEEIKGYTQGYFPESFEHAYQIDLYAAGVTLLHVLSFTKSYSLSESFKQLITKYLKKQEDPQIECKDIPFIFLSQLQEQQFLPFLMRYLNKINLIIHQDLYDVKKNIFQSTQALLSYLQLKEIILSTLLKSEENLTNSVHQQQVQMKEELTQRDSLLEEILRHIYMSGRIYMQLGEFDSARGVFVKILDELTKNGNLEQKKSIQMKAKCMRKLGRCDEQEMNIEESLRLQTETLDFLLKSPLSTDLITIKQYWIVSQCYSQLNNEEESRQYFEIFRSYIDRQQLKSAKQYMSLLYSIGCKYLDQNKLELAAKYLNELKDLYIFNSTTSINLKEANCYLQLGKLCLKIQEQQTSLFLNNESIVPQTENKQTDLLIRRSTNQIKEALQNFQKSLQMKERVYHQNNLCLSELYIYIGECYTYLQEKSNAIDFLERAFNIRFNAFQFEHPLTDASIFQLLLFYYRMDDISNPQVENLLGYLQNSKYLKSYQKTLQIISAQNLENTQKQDQIQNIVNIILGSSENMNSLNFLLSQLYEDHSINFLELFRKTERIKSDPNTAQTVKESQAQSYLKILQRKISEQLNSKQRYKNKINDNRIGQKIQHQEELKSEDIEYILLQTIGRKGQESLQMLDLKYNHISFEEDLRKKVFKEDYDKYSIDNKIYSIYGKCHYASDLQIQNIVIQQNTHFKKNNLSLLCSNQMDQYYFCLSTKQLFHRIKAFLMEFDSTIAENQIIQKKIIYQIVQIVFQLVKDDCTISQVNLDNFFINPKSYEVVFFVNQYTLRIQSLIKRDYNSQVNRYIFRAAMCLLYIDNYNHLDSHYSVLFSEKLFEDDNSEDYRAVLKELASIKRNTYAFSIVQKLLNTLNKKDVNLDELYEQIFPEFHANQDREINKRSNHQIGFLKIENTANLKSIDFRSLRILEIMVGGQRSNNFDQIREFIKVIGSMFSEMLHLDSFSMTFYSNSFDVGSSVLTQFTDGLKICKNLKNLTLNINDTSFNEEAVLYLLESLITLQKLEKLTLSMLLLNKELIQVKLSEVISLLPLLNHFQINQINLQFYKKLEPSIAKQENLESLDLAFKDDSGVEFESNVFPKSIKILKLQFLKLVNTNLMPLLSFGIGQCSQLQELYLSIKYFEEENIKSFLNPLNFQSIQLVRLEINVEMSKINQQESFILIGEIVSEQRYLQYLNLTFQHHAHSFYANLQKLFSGISNCTQLNTLKLEFNEKIAISETDSLLLSSSLIQCQELQHCHIKIECNNPQMVSNIFEGNNKFKKLTSLNCSFENCRISPKEMNAISNMLQMCTNLISLNLNFFNNLIGNSGARSLGEGISNCNQLRNLSLNIKNCQLESQGLYPICLSISTFKFLKKFTLVLASNKIGDADLQILGSSLLQCPNLNILFLDIEFKQKYMTWTQVYNFYEGISTMKSLYFIYINWRFPKFIKRILFKSLKLVKFN